MDIKDRIKLIMENEQVSSKRFAETLGIQQSTLSHILTNRNQPSLDVIMKIHQIYTDVNIDWLLYGTGDMFVSQESGKKQEKATTSPPMNNLFATPVAAMDAHPASRLQATEKEKTVIKVMVFYSDQTYETFIPKK